ncbi:MULTISPECIES: peptidylprolyl isomerase [unclassified Aminobacter]|uniref:peptidylprolyl isomerase n=1 Tax=unclassified Aminobacter TaxID=2644704 RepID=UPI000466EDAB|nr:MULTISPECIES: peptidylprolyl isomerase [unclassified Aminobacter]TWG55147.1 peptidyl-prolyl cis-trans isomerase C [Aminobacter sp. J44]
MIHSFRRLPIISIGVAATMFAFAGAAGAQADKPADAPTNAVVATINGKPITETDLQVAMADLEQQFAQLPAEQRRAAALSAIIEIRLMADKAEGAGLAETDEFKSRMSMLRDRALHSAYIEKNIAQSVSDDAIRARYDEEIKELPAAEEIRARHIIVNTEEEAKAIIAELDAGGDFEAIAKEKSQDGAAAQGGDLGYFGKGRMVPEFEQAAFALEVGSYSKEPVKTQFGWHVVKVEDKRNAEPPAFEQVQHQFRSLLLREAYFDAVSKLRDEAKVEITDSALKDALEAAEAGDEETPANE